MSDWKTWKASPPVEVLAPREKYECPDLPVKPSRAGESEGPENALRDPALFQQDRQVVSCFTQCAGSKESAART